MTQLERRFVSLDELAATSPHHYATLLIDPPWRFANRTGKVAPEHRRLSRYGTMSQDDLRRLPIPDLVAANSHLYLWCPNALLAEGLDLMRAWGFQYKTNIVWFKVRKDGEADGRGVGFYFRNVTELVLFGVRGRMRTLSPGRRQTNLLRTRKREHSKKPYELYDIIRACSPGPYLELFARERAPGWESWGDEVDTCVDGGPADRGGDGDRRTSLAADADHRAPIRRGAARPAG